MSDQSSATQKPKPGSLRDRIAAFEKSATTGAVNAPPPLRSKPASFATWKPKQTSPPSSPPATQTEHVQGPSSSMSASDARESITKGASLKERMAALQNKGAFGAPPPVGPKPTGERPKWKPPPVVQSNDVDSQGIFAIEKSISPLSYRHEQNAGDSERDSTPGADAESAKEDAEVLQDHEEAERQRRAAIAARMARLGGARVGMSPPIVGKKPPRRATQEEQKTADTVNPAGVPLPSEPPTSPEEQKPCSNERDELIGILPLTDNVSSSPEILGLAPSRKSSTNTTVEVGLGHSPKIPSSMPVPSVPRRTGPPRKKPSKPEPPKEDHAISALNDTVVPEDSESKLETSIGPSLIYPEVKALGGDLQEISVHDNSEEVQKHDVVRPPESASLPNASSSAFQQVDLPLAHALESSETIENSDEENSQHLSSLAKSGIISPSENEKDGIEPIAGRPGGINPLTSQPALSSNPVFHQEVRSEPSKPIQEDLLYGDQSEVLDSAYNLDIPSDQNPVLPPQIPANHASASRKTFDVSESIDAPHISGDSAAPSDSVPPPRRIIPAIPEEETEQEFVGEPGSDEETNENLARSHLIIPPPKERNATHLKQRDIQDEDESENDAPALPVPHRHSMDMRAPRSIPAMQSDSSSEPDTDHDGQPLPVPPRPITRVVPPSRPQEYSQNDDEEQTNVATCPMPLDREVMDENEGDPIDPDFHVPSRRSSHLDLAQQASSPSTHPDPPPLSPPTILSSRSPATLQPVQYIPSPPGQSNQPEKTETESDEIAETRRRTIAERMARLGGIKFGTAPIPRPASSAFHESGRVDVDRIEEDTPDEPSDEEGEERARKERIAAKLANMGGMRIGMMPIGISSIPTKGFQEEAVPTSPSHPVAPVRPSRLAPQPPEQTPDTVNEPDAGSPFTSDDGVKVEAEESEAEEVNYQDADPDEIPPIPSRSGRPTRRQSSGDTAVSPPQPVRRPPVPATPPRRMSAQFTSPQSTPAQRKDSFHAPQYDYVVVDQIKSQETPPTRRTSMALPAVSSPEATTAESQENISQWELPSIPASTLDFGGGADLSLSWTDAGDSLSSSQPNQSPSIRGRSRRQLSTDLSLTSDDLMAMWGRVGVQVCEAATTLFEKSKKSLVGDGTYAGFVDAVLADVPNAASISVDTEEYGYLIYSQNGSVVQKRASEIMPGDIMEVHDARFKGHKGLQTYQTTIGSGEPVIGIVSEFDTKKLKIKAFQANQHVGQQTVESVSYRLEDLKSGTVKIHRVLEAA